MSKNCLIGIVALLFFVFSAPVQSQQPTKIARIGFVTNNDGFVETFRQTLGELGYVEGKHIHYEYRFIEGQQEKVPALVAELVRLKVDVLVVTTLTSIRAAKQATNTIPIVMVTTNDPVATRIVDSLARPGGNITGVTSLTRELNAKRLELLKETVPKLSRVGVLWDANGPGPTISFSEYQSAAQLLRIKLESLEIRRLNLNFERAFLIAAKGHASAIIAIRSGVLNREQGRIAELAIKNRLPGMYESGDFVEAGGLLSYSANQAEQNRRAASYAYRILKGAQPADLPVEQASKFELVINLKTAKQIGLTIPPSVLARADRVIR